MGVTGRDEVLLILGVNSFESDSDLDIEAFSWQDTSTCPFSTSVLESFGLKPTFGIRFFREDLLRGGGGGGGAAEEEVGPGELEVKEKLTLLGVGLGVGGILMTTESSGERLVALEGICKERLLRLHCWTFAEVSSVIAEEDPSSAFLSRTKIKVNKRATWELKQTQLFHKRSDATNNTRLSDQLDIY